MQSLWSIAFLLLLSVLVAQGGCTDQKEPGLAQISEPADGRARISSLSDAIAKNDLTALDGMLCATMIRDSVKMTLDDLGPDGRSLFQASVRSATFDPARSSPDSAVYIARGPDDDVHHLVLRSENGQRCMELP